jgi:hypothetical protein
MGAAISSTLSMGLTYCCCTAAGSVCNACLGGQGPGTTGRKRSVLLLTIAIALALWFQYAVGPAIVSQSGWIWSTYRWIPGVGKMVFGAWKDGCTNTEDNASDVALLHQCAGNAGVYRPTIVAALFFATFAVATKVTPSLNTAVWPAKFALYLFAVAASVFMSNSVFTGALLWFARFGATLFLLLQQIILIDVAYNWNEDWLDRADQSDRYEYGSGGVWLRAIVATCVAFYSLTILGIGILYRVFNDCPENTWIITLTLLGVIALTGIQLSGQEGSLLTSSVISLYSTYLAYSMVSKNPNASCNPQLGNNDVWGIVIGLTLTAISLAWTGWSWTAEERLNVEGVQSTKPVDGNTGPQVDNVNLDVPFLNADQQPTAGLVMEQHDENGTGNNSQVWKLNVVMTLICCFVAMTLTAWGTMDEVLAGDDHEARAANPTVGRVNMAMIGISQWLAIGLYVWTLVAPKLFPDRDFS